MEKISKKISLLIALLLMISSCSALKVSSEEKAAQEAALRSAIEKQEYKIEVNRMHPMKGGSRQLTSLYSLEIKGDTVVSYLPYFGEAYSIPYGGGKGLNFTAKITAYNFVFDNKGKAVIDLETKNEEDRYSYHIDIFPNGSTNINVRSDNRQSIAFTGTAGVINNK
jgi:hypothetical protein